MGDEMNARHYKIIRNMIVFVGMAVAFVIWLFLPDTFKNSALFHVGNIHLKKLVSLAMA